MTSAREGPGWLGPRRGRAFARDAIWVLVLIGLAKLLGGRHFGDDAVVLISFVMLGGGGVRAAIGLLTILAFVASFPPLGWPLFWICAAPMTWLWRIRAVPGRNWIGEAFGVGFAMCWLTSPFVRSDFGDRGIFIQAFAGAWFGLQVVGIAAGLRVTRHWPILPAAMGVSLIATASEWLRVYLLSWPLLVLAFPAAPTPIAQWAYYVTPFGVSFLLYAINFLWLPDPADWRRIRGWTAPLVASSLAALAWFGGERIAAGTRVESIPFSALLVQPNRVVVLDPEGKGAGMEIPRLLDGLTRDALADEAPVDLIVWPEGSIQRAGEAPATSPVTGRDGPTLDWFYHDRLPIYRTPCLVGALVETPDGRRFNSACLLTPGGAMSRYDKHMLVVGAESDFTPGGDYRRLEFADRRGRRLRLGVSICYEMHFPWLPQYRSANRPDAIVHLNNESWYHHYPGMHIHGTWACQYRAIETRTWQLVCATWSRSAAIDPRGRIRAMLPARAAVLRVSDDADSGRGDAPGSGLGHDPESIH